MASEASIKVFVGATWTDSKGREWRVTERKPFGRCCIQSGLRFGEMYERDVRRILAEQVAA